MMPSANRFGPNSTTHSPDPIEELGTRAEALWRRVLDIERALSVQEWWLLGRAIAEARLLAEIASLLAVARGELENALSQGFDRALPFTGQGDALTAAQEPPQPENPTWLAASRDQAIGLLRMVATALPPMQQYATMLQTYGGRAGLASPIVDSFGIVTDRLNEIAEALRQPPH